MAYVAPIRTPETLQEKVLSSDAVHKLRQISPPVPHIEFVQRIKQQDPDGQPTLYIYDNLMKDTTKSVDVCELYTEGSHHCNLSVICLLQNLYHPGKENGTINLNTQYIILFRNPRYQ